MSLMHPYVFRKNMQNVLFPAGLKRQETLLCSLVQAPFQPALSPHVSSAVSGTHSQAGGAPAVSSLWFHKGAQLLCMLTLTERQLLHLSEAGGRNPSHNGTFSNAQPQQSVPDF